MPKSEIDDNPNEEDMEFMKQAQEVANRSPDDRTKVSSSQLSTLLLVEGGWGVMVLVLQ